MKKQILPLTHLNDMGKTITTYLVNGDPEGTQYSFISNKICQMYVVPRSDLAYLKTQKKLETPAMYILIGEDEVMNPQAYIGQTGNFCTRVKDHDNKKPFWQKAFIFVSKDTEMTTTDVQYLEYKALVEAQKANSYNLCYNKQEPQSPNLPEHQKDSMDEFFEDVKLLATFKGCNIFEVFHPKSEHLFYVKSKDCDAVGFYSSSGFTVLKGSVIAKEMAPSFNWKDKRNGMVQEYATMDGDKLVMTSDKTFSSASSAASFCLGRSANGWTEWKDTDGKTLDFVYRKQLE